MRPASFASKASSATLTARGFGNRTRRRRFALWRNPGHREHQRQIRLLSSISRHIPEATCIPVPPVAHSYGPASCLSERQARSRMGGRCLGSNQKSDLTASRSPPDRHHLTTAQCTPPCSKSSLASASSQPGMFHNGQDAVPTMRVTLCRMVKSSTSCPRSRRQQHRHRHHNRKIKRRRSKGNGLLFFGF
jgi:hypothetical protein